MAFSISGRLLSASTCSDRFAKSAVSGLAMASLRHHQHPRRLYSSESPPPIDNENTQPKVAIFWDLDNKKPPGAAAEIVDALRRLACEHGQIVQFSAIANRVGSKYLPPDARQRIEARKALQQQHDSPALSEPLRCIVCGSKRKSEADLLKHYKTLHERERVKLNNHLASKRGKKKAHFRAVNATRLKKFAAAYRNLLHPRLGYNIIEELCGLGVAAKSVPDGKDVADHELVKQLRAAQAKLGALDVLVIVTDDRVLVERVRRKAKGARVLVISETKHQKDWYLWPSLVEGGSADSLALGALEELHEDGDLEDESSSLENDFINSLLNDSHDSDDKWAKFQSSLEKKRLPKSKKKKKPLKKRNIE